MIFRGGGGYEKLMVLLYTDPTKNIGDAKGCTLNEMPKVGRSIAPTVPPVPSPLQFPGNSQSCLNSDKSAFRGT